MRGDKHDYTRVYQHLQFSFRSYLLKQLILRRLINRAAERLLQVYEILLWRHNERGVVSNHRRFYCLFKRLFRRRSKKTSKLRITGLRDGNLPVTGGFPSQRASNAENVSIWWRYHVMNDVMLSACCLTTELYIPIQYSTNLECVSCHTTVTADLAWCCWCHGTCWWQVISVDIHVGIKLYSCFGIF